MAKTKGFVGTIESETRNVSRLWFSLTDSANNNDWVKIGAVRAWFSVNLESAAQSSHMAQLTLLMEAMRTGLEVEISHGGAATFTKNNPNDSFEVDSIRILRKGLQF